MSKRYFFEALEHTGLTIMKQARIKRTAYGFYVYSYKTNMLLFTADYNRAISIAYYSM